VTDRCIDVPGHHLYKRVLVDVSTKAELHKKSEFENERLYCPLMTPFLFHYT
jgi:hypothetical protein